MENQYYKGIDGTVCPSCRSFGSFRNGFCFIDKTPQYPIETATEKKDAVSLPTEKKDDVRIPTEKKDIMSFPAKAKKGVVSSPNRTGRNCIIL